MTTTEWTAPASNIIAEANKVIAKTEIEKIARLKMIQAYAIAGLSHRGIVQSNEQSSAEYHNFWHMKDATAAAKAYAELTGRDFYEVRAEMFDQFM